MTWTRLLLTKCVYICGCIDCLSRTATVSTQLVFSSASTLSGLSISQSIIKHHVEYQHSTLRTSPLFENPNMQFSIAHSTKISRGPTDLAEHGLVHNESLMWPTSKLVDLDTSDRPSQVVTSDEPVILTSEDETSRLVTFHDELSSDGASETLFDADVASDRSTTLFDWKCVEATPDHHFLCANTQRHEISCFVPHNKDPATIDAARIATNLEALNDPACIPPTTHEHTLLDGRTHSFPEIRSTAKSLGNFGPSFVLQRFVTEGPRKTPWSAYNSRVSISTHFNTANLTSEC
jgi:hypothetical protein